MGLFTVGSDILKLILESVWFLLPAYFANMTPVLVKNIRFLDTPVDFGKKFMGKPLFGKNKTYRGFVFGTIAAILITYVQYLLYTISPFIREHSLLNYEDIRVYALGFLMGFGSLVGDLIKSFFKRRFSIPPGKTWFPFDQSDYILGAMLFIAPVYSLKVKYFLPMLFLSIILHILINLLGYYMGLKKNKL